VVEDGDDRVMDRRDSAALMPKCVVAGPGLSPSGLRPAVPWTDTVLYETHVRGFTQSHPGVPASMRGRYAGLGSPAVLTHLRALGVTAIELLPVHAFMSESVLAARGMVNFWGYSSIGFFAPHPAYASSPAVAQVEFQAMVAALHGAGLEVILDVVYNHTAEGSELGPCLSFKGIDNASYYRLPAERRRYVNDTGCGNTLNLDHPRVLQMVMDSLRHWVTEMGVDGFRFDLAPVLGRSQNGPEPGGYDPASGFLQACRQDPVLAGVKLIAEPWDCGPGGYRTGQFPPGWAEWNDKFRDDARLFWSGADGATPGMAARLSGSSHLFQHRGRKPWASVNFVTAHDGFTLQDVVSFAVKHNDANGEDGRDGTDANYSWNHGAEGPAAAPAIAEARQRSMRNLLATLLFSQGTPMLLAGDEFGRSQGGNNNAYCQDNAVSWVDWDIPAWGQAQMAFTARLIRLRTAHAALRQGRFFTGVEHEGVRDVTWLGVDGLALSMAAWGDARVKCFGMLVDGRAGAVPPRAPGPPLLIVMNPTPDAVGFTLPPCRDGTGWAVVLDTARPERNEAEALAAGRIIGVPGSSLLLLALVMDRRAGLAGPASQTREQPWA